MSEFDPETRPACDRGDDEAFAMLSNQTAPGIFDFIAAWCATIDDRLHDPAVRRRQDPPRNHPCLKRYIARQLFTIIRNPAPADPFGLSHTA